MDEAEVDERWSFVGTKTNGPWVWIAMDASTRQVIAFHVGDRSSQSATALWETIPVRYQDQAIFYTEQYAVYTGVIPPYSTYLANNVIPAPITKSASVLIAILAIPAVLSAQKPTFLQRTTESAPRGESRLAVAATPRCPYSAILPETCRERCARSRFP